MERCFREGIGIDVGDRCLLEDRHGFFSHNDDQLILEDELESSMEGWHDCTAVCNQGLFKSMLYGKSTLITSKLTRKDLRLISIISSISPCTLQCVPSKALMILVLGLISNISTFRHSRVTNGKTFRANQLSINTFVTIMSSHLTMICMAKVWSLPFGGNSSLKKETWLVANINDSIPLKEESVIPVGTCVSFNTFNKASQWTSKDSNKAKIEIWAGDLFNCWITL